MIRGAVIVLFALALAAPAHAAAPRAVVIREGASIGRIALGATEGSLTASGGRCAGTGQARRCDLDGAHATFGPAGAVFVTWTTSARARTRRGVGVGSRLALLRARYGRSLIRHGADWALAQPAATTTFTVRRGVVSIVTIRRSVAPKIAYAGLRLTDTTPGLVSVTGAATGDTLHARLALGAHVVDLPSSTVAADGTGRVTLPRTTVAELLTTDGLVGDQQATVEATVSFPQVVTRRFAITIEGLAADPLVLTGPPRGLVRPGQLLVPLTIEGIRPAGPPIAVRYTDCLEVEHSVLVPRTTPTATVALDPTSTIRMTLEAACTADALSPTVVFEVGLVLAGRFSPAATTVELSFLP